MGSGQRMRVQGVPAPSDVYVTPYFDCGMYVRVPMSLNAPALGGMVSGCEETLNPAP